MSASPDGATPSVLVLGAPRSGTSWLGKILDSHPDVLYRHEPDVVLRDDAIPFRCRSDQVQSLLPRARDYLRHLAHVRRLRSAGSLPVFRKNYHNALQHRLREGWIFALRLAELMPGPAAPLARLDVPDLADIDRDRSIRVVLKSVGALGRAELFARAVPDSRTILLLRHPCGHVASVVRGVTTAKMGRVMVKDLAAIEQAQRRNLSAERLGAMSLIEKAAWSWALLNEKAMEDLSGLPTVTILRYEDLCERWEDITRELFDFVGLDWNPQTEEFLRRSTTFSGKDERYYQIFRDPVRSANKWQTELSREDVKTILGIAEQSAPGRLFI